MSLTSLSGVLQMLAYRPPVRSISAKLASFCGLVCRPVTILFCGVRHNVVRQAETFRHSFIRSGIQSYDAHLTTISMQHQ